MLNKFTLSGLRFAFDKSLLSDHFSLNVPKSFFFFYRFYLCCISCTYTFFLANPNRFQALPSILNFIVIIRLSFRRKKKILRLRHSGACCALWRSPLTKPPPRACGSQKSGVGGARCQEQLAATEAAARRHARGEWMRRRASGLFGEAEPEFLGSTQRRGRPMCVHVRVCALAHRLFRINAPSSRRRGPRCRLDPTSTPRH